MIFIFGFHIFFNEKILRKRNRKASEVVVSLLLPRIFENHLLCPHEEKKEKISEDRDEYGQKSLHFACEGQTTVNC